MKHLKLFEELDRTYKVEDFLDIPYWRYRNKTVDTIMKAEYLDNDQYKYNSNWNFTFLSLKEIDEFFFYELTLKNDFLYEIIKLDIPEKILRPATEEEIELFKGHFLTRKYNI